MFDSMFATMSFSSSKERRRIEDMFDSYMSDLPQNLYENQFSLQNKYEGTAYQDWVRILTHPAFDTWKQQQIAIIATTSTDRALAGVDTNKDTLSLLKMRQEVLNSEKTAEKPTIIVLPEELFFRGE